MRRQHFLWLAVVALFLLACRLAYACLPWFFPNYTDYPVLFLRLMAAIGTFCAVFVALFGDYLREFWNPVRVDIEIPKRANSVIDRPSGVADNVYCHHLRVMNHALNKPTMRCQVLLKRILIQGLDGQWRDNETFAVPRLMNWAPSEWHKDERTFAMDQLFDLGSTMLSNDGGFKLAINPDQGGTLTTKFNAGQKLGFGFCIAAANYHRSKEFCFEVWMPKSISPQNPIPSEVKEASKELREFVRQPIRCLKLRKWANRF